MRTAEEILKDHIDKESMDSLSENVWPDMIEAMEEYKNQFKPTSKYENIARNVNPYDTRSVKRGHRKFTSGRGYY